MTEPKDNRSRKVQYGINAILGSVLFLVILVAVNGLASLRDWRFDATSNKYYTLSEATLNVLQRLDDRVNVTVYATASGTPATWTQQRNQLRNFLKDYRYYSNNRVSFTFRDPVPGSDAQQDARNAGILEQTMQEAGATEITLKMGYLGAVVQHKGRTETIPYMRPDFPLEYLLTSAISKVAQVDQPTIGILAPQGNPFMGQPSQYSAVVQSLEDEGYEVEQLEGDLDAETLGELKMVMIFDFQDLSDESLYHLDQWLMKGGKLFVSCNGVRIDQQTGRATAERPRINNLLEAYGVRIDSNLVEDWGRGIVSTFVTQSGLVQSRNPFLMAATELTTASVITQDFKRPLLFAYPSSVSTTDFATTGSITPLVKSSNRSRLQETIFTLQQDRLSPLPDTAEASQFNLAIQVKGPFASRYAIADPPVITEDDGTTRSVVASEIVRESSPESEVVVVGSSFSYIDDIAARGEGIINAIFLINVADGLIRGGDMIRLRSRQPAVAALRADISDEQANRAQFAVIAGTLALLGAFAFANYVLFRMRRRRYLQQYGH